MKDIYEKLEIPEPSSDLEDRIIAQAHGSNKKQLFPRLAVMAACFAIIFAVWSPQQAQQEFAISDADLLYDVEFFDEDEEYAFIDDLTI